MDNKLRATSVAEVLAIAVLAAVVLAWPTQLLWNACLVPAVDGINPVGFWQALGLNILTNILIKSNTSSKK
jgi:hypothetical protein